MAAPSMYDLTRTTVSPVENLLKALVEANEYARQADAAGWIATFTVDPERNQIDVRIERGASWPSLEKDEPF